MRAVAIDRFGSADELHLVDLPLPEPGAGQVRVKVAAAGVNPLDYKIRDGSSGLVKDFDPANFPLVLGRECAGVVDAVGEGITGLAVGQRVFGMAPLAHPGGCYAEYVVLPADCLAVSPSEVDDLVLAGAALVGLTAWVAVHDLARVRSGDVVLVHGGAGGVGQVVVQLAVAAGAQVYATSGPANRDRIEAMGATHIDYTSVDFRTAVPSPQVIVDGVYFGTYEPSMDHLAPGGRLVVLPSLADLAPARERGIDVSVPSITADRSRLDRLAAMIAARSLSLEVGHVFRLAEAAAAHRQVETGHTRGKIVLTVAC
ncbi:2-haloacrylate reductase [Austwickia sp. TVS 96-490-7B]|uniref:NADP-dependent oxidoreductase n=1 Tax=Austwickia sp. TVS 96-490-7B TaxID=2830843 RepID=UPI001C5756E7|nr:NADP-dependent oxidoreductase [Austwickia sp. TVS 96-490-7B]MBW3084913.1 2-haloacrylate reductase [Austwickia sp. TVS 96-490-7B]